MTDLVELKMKAFTQIAYHREELLMASWKIKCQLCHFQKQRCPYARTQMPWRHRRQPKPKTPVMLAIWWAHRPLDSSLHILARATSLPLIPTQTEPPRWDHHLFFFFLITVLTADMLGLMLSGKLSPWKRKRESPQISVESLPRTVNIFGSPRRTNAFWRLAESAVLKREWLQADWWWSVGATFSVWHLRQAVSSLEWEQNAPSMGWWRHAKISQKTPSRIRITCLCLCL